MNVAFYAPLKPPDHAIPSGDRTMARALGRALTLGGHRVQLASRFRSFEAAGNGVRQRALRQRGEGLAARLLRRYLDGPAASRPQLWFTYHLYHKSPDWLGPRICAGLQIPYVIAEASHALKQRHGPWSEGYAAAAAGIRQAAALVCLNPADVPGLVQLAGAATVHEMPPFIDVARLARDAARAPRPACAPGVPRLLSVAMMRAGDKLASYRILAQSLSRLLDRPWQLQIVGDGPARAQVEAAFVHLPPGRVRFLGQVAREQLGGLLRGATAHLWPAVNEAWGMVFLEAAAVGVASVAGDAGGVRTVIEHGRTGVLTTEGDVVAFAGAVAALLSAPERARAMGEAARERARRRHDLPVAARRLSRVLEQMV